MMSRSGLTPPPSTPTQVGLALKLTLPDQVVVSVRSRRHVDESQRAEVTEAVVVEREGFA